MNRQDAKARRCQPGRWTLSDRRSFSRGFPRVDPCEAASGESGGVAGCYRGAGSGCGRRYQSVEPFDGLSRPTAEQNNFDVAPGCGPADCEHPAGKFFREQRLGSRGRIALSTPFRQGIDAVEQFSFIDASGVQGIAWLCSDPGHDRGMWLRPHQFGNDIGVEDDHRPNSGGSPTVTGGWGSRSSTPPKGAKRRRMASARLQSRVWSLPTASLRMARSSASMERPLRAARTRSLSFTAGATLRMVSVLVDVS